MPVNRSPAIKAPSEETLAPFNVKRRVEGDVTKYYYGPKRSHILLNTFIERCGFDPEDGEVFDADLVPAEYRERLGLNGLPDPSRSSKIPKEDPPKLLWNGRAD